MPPRFFTRAFLSLLVCCLACHLVAAPEAEKPATGAELFDAGLRAFQAKEWTQAEGYLARFLADYQEQEEARGAVAEALPLLALCQLRLRRFDQALGSIESALALPHIRPAWRSELSFWKGVCQYQAGQVAEGQQSFQAYFQSVEKGEPRRWEAAVLFGAGYLMLEQDGAALVFLREAEEILREESPETAKRLVLLEFRALLRLGQLDGALALVRRESPELEKHDQMVSFQSLALELGSRLLEAERPAEAIQCLRNVWPQQRVLRFQEERLRGLEQGLLALRARGDQDALVFQQEGRIQRLKRELEHFKTLPEYDAAVRLRVAKAFIGLERFHEAALVMEDILMRLPATPLVEGHTLHLMDCWARCERWAKVAEVADAYSRRFGQETPNAPAVLFLKADALRRCHQHREAAVVFGQIRQRYPETALAKQALFMEGICQLHLEQYDAAIESFGRVSDMPGVEEALSEQALYWTAMAHSFALGHEQALSVARRVQKEYPQGGRRFDAIFREAFSLHALARHQEAKDHFQHFLREAPDNEFANEARLLLGDGLLALGEVENGLSSFREIPTDAGSLFEEASFRIAKAFRLTERFSEMTQHLEGFVREHAESPRLAEAIHWLAWCDQQLGRQENARLRCWDVLRQHGNEAEQFAMEDLLSFLPKLYPGTEREAFFERLRQVRQSAITEKLKTLALRCQWAEAIALRRERPTSATQILLRASQELQPRIHHPRIIADFAEAALEEGDRPLAREWFRELRRWHPSSLERDRAELGLAKVAMFFGENAEAQVLLEKLSRRPKGLVSSAEIGLTLAACLEKQERAEEALAVYQRLAEERNLPSARKAECLLRIGRLLVAAGKAKPALAYFERVYLGYGKHRPQVAAAFWERGQALESLAEFDKAKEVYQAMLGRPELSDTQEAGKVRQRLETLSSKQG